MKKLLQKSDDPYLAMLNYRATPLHWCGLSPTELLMGRKVRTTLPQTTSQFIPDWKYIEEYRKSDNKYKQKQKENYDQRHRVRPQSPLSEDTPVLVRTGSDTARVSRVISTNTSFLSCSPSGQLRRNRFHLVPLNSPIPTTPNVQSRSNPRSSPIMTRSRTGTVIRPPDKLNL